MTLLDELYAWIKSDPNQNGQLYVSEILDKIEELEEEYE